MNFRTEPLHEIEVVPDPQPIVDPQATTLTVLPPNGTTPEPCKESSIFVVRRYRPFLTTEDPRHKSCVPEIRFGGVYLYRFGFPIGTRVVINIKRGKIIITPHEDQPYLPKGDAEPLASQAKRLCR